MNQQAATTTRNEGIRTAGDGNWPVVRAMGCDVTLNLYGRTNLLLDLLYKQGLLPNMMAHGNGEEGSDDLYVCGDVNIGSTDQTVQFAVWRMVENWRQHGVLFDDDFALAMRAVRGEPQANECLIAAAPELLEALIAAEKSLNDIRVCCAHTAWDATGPAVIAARAAIAKATGGAA